MKVIRGELGDHLCDAVARGKREILCGALRKLSVIQRLLAAVAEGVPGKIYTRWRPEEVAAGVTDLEVFDAVSARPGGVSTYVQTCMQNTIESMMCLSLVLQTLRKPL